MAAMSDIPPSREVTLPAPVALPASVPADEDVTLTTMERDQLRETIRRTLTYHAGDSPDASAVAAAIVSIWQQVAALLEPVIGDRGVDVLFRRSLHLAHVDFPWLAIAGGESKESAEFLASLKERLAGCETEVAAEASYVLLVTFTELLITLIGESLAARLLGPVWLPPPPASQEISS